MADIFLFQEEFGPKEKRFEPLRFRTLALVVGAVGVLGLALGIIVMANGSVVRAGCL